LGRLGPDLLAPDFDEAEARARLRAAGEQPIADALLDQSIVAGIGNVYKSEILFMERVSPFDSVTSLDDETLRRLLLTAQRQLRRNVGTGQRRTTNGRQSSALWVYDRAGRPCARCGAPLKFETARALRLWDGLSVYRTQEQAETRARMTPHLGQYIAELAIPL